MPATSLQTAERPASPAGVALKVEILVIGAGIALSVVSLLAYGLTQDPRELPNALPGHPAPAFTALPAPR